MPRSVCVFCGAHAGTRALYTEAARATGRMLAQHGWRLVYGAGDAGLMGEVARAAIAGGAPTLGVVPAHLIAREAADMPRVDPSTRVVTQTMHERKTVMFANADAIVLLPGGAGSLDEFFEVLTWAQIGLHDKPILLLDAGGYWQPLMSLIDHIVAEGFADPSVRDLYRPVPDVAALEAALTKALA